MIFKFPTAALVLMLAFGLAPPGAVASDLVEAVKERDMAAARALITQGGEVNVSDSEGMTPLHWAAYWDDPEMVRFLLDAGADARASNRYGVTPLHEAATASNPAVVRMLLKAGADPNQIYGAGETPVMVAARTGNVEVLRMLLDHGGNVEQPEEYRGQTPLMMAVVENHPAAVEFLVDRGADVDAPSTQFEFEEVRGRGAATGDRPVGGLAPLHFAARHGAIEVAQVLIAAGANPDAAEPQYGFTPMQTALFNGKYDFAGFLLENGADVNDGSLYVAVEMKNLGFYSNRPNPPEIDRTLGSFDIIQMLLERGADPNRPYTKTIPARQAQGAIRVPPGFTPFHRAARSLDVATLILLAQNGANPSRYARDGSTPFLVAAEQALRAPAPRRGDNEEDVAGGTSADPTDILRIFFAAGADPNEVHRGNGNTAMHMAAQAGLDGAIEFLASIGGRFDIRNQRDLTPLEMVRNPESTTAALIRRLMGETGSTASTR